MRTSTLEKIPGYEAVHRFEDDSLGAVAFIALHSSVLGTPLGGCRVRSDYPHEAAALSDALRLAEGMTRKAAIHRLPLGGGKMTVWVKRPLHEIDREKLFGLVGRAVESLGGDYITAEDMNTTVDDMKIIMQHTAFAAGVASGDPSEFTALGVWEVIKFLACNRLQKSLEDCRLAVQGAGKVGEILLRTAAENGVREMILTDIVFTRAQKLADELGYSYVEPSRIFAVECDIFVPCAYGGILNTETIAQLNCRAVAGAANNQLEDPERDEALLARRGILYCPDVVVNGGGIINVSCEFPIYNRKRAETLTAKIPETLNRVLFHAKKQNISNTLAVKELTDRILQPADRDIARGLIAH
jgi:leucine dehydrogenase